MNGHGTKEKGHRKVREWRDIAIFSENDETCETAHIAVKKQAHILTKFIQSLDPVIPL